MNKYIKSACSIIIERYCHSKDLKKINIPNIREHIDIAILKILSRQHTIKNYPNMISINFIQTKRNLRSQTIIYYLKNRI